MIEILLWVLTVAGGTYAAYRSTAGMLGGLIVASALRDAASLPVGGGHLTAFGVLLPICGGIWVVREVKAGWRAGAPIGPLAAALPLLPLVGLISVSVAGHPARALQYAGLLALLTVFALIFARFATPDETMGSTSVVVFVAMSCVLAVVGLLQVAWPGMPLGNHSLIGANPTHELVRPAAFYLDTNFLGTHLAVALLLALAMGAAARGRMRLLWFGAAMLCGGVTALTLSRTAWLVIAVGVVVLALTSPKGTRWPAVVTLAAALVAVLVVAQVIPGRLQLGDNASSRTRRLMYVSTAEMIRDKPLLGVGLENFQYVYPAYRKQAALPQIAHPHQVPLALVAETGLPGLVAEIVLVVSVVVTFGRRRRIGWSAYDAALLAVMVGLLSGSLLQFYLYFPVLWLMTGLTASGTGPIRWPARRAAETNAA